MPIEVGFVVAVTLLDWYASGQTIRSSGPTIALISRSRCNPNVRHLPHSASRNRPVIKKRPVILSDCIAASYAECSGYLNLLSKF